MARASKSPSISISSSRGRRGRGSGSDGDRDVRGRGWSSATSSGGGSVSSDRVRVTFLMVVEVWHGVVCVRGYGVWQRSRRKCMHFFSVLFWVLRPLATGLAQNALASTATTKSSNS